MTATCSLVDVPSIVAALLITMLMLSFANSLFLEIKKGVTIRVCLILTN